jgi:superfamily II DNA/RNA helicase
MDNQKDSFESLNLNKNLVEGIYLHGFTKPSPIQINGIMSINTGKDCILQSQSGTGKTATYLLGVLNRLDPDTKECQGIIITPTRELAEQVHDVATKLAHKTEFKTAKCVGGTDIKQNIADLKESSVVIGTKGRIHHMIKEKKINIKKLKFIVLDEADEILSDGVCEKTHYILENAPTDIQAVLISATMSTNVFHFSKKFMHDPCKILLKNNEVAVDLISQFHVDVGTEDNKFETLLDLFSLVSTSKTIIFCNSIDKVQYLQEQLSKNNFTVTAIHSKMSQSDRDEIVRNFTKDTIRILLSTDLLSRGIDVTGVNMVINYDLPSSKETYIHRIGRCGRFDKKGVAITLVNGDSPTDSKKFSFMQRKYQLDIKPCPSSINEYL